MWFKTDGSINGDVFSIHQSSSTDGWQRLIFGGNNDLTFLSRAVSGSATSISIGSAHQYTNNEWHQVIITVNSGSVTAYINGQQISTGTLRGGTYHLDRISLGSLNPSSNFYNGYIDEVAIWDRVLTSSEVEELYDLQKDGFESGQYPFITSTPFFQAQSQNYSGVKLLNFNLTLANSTQYTTTNGTIVTPINDSLEYTFTISSEKENSKISQTFTNHNTTENIVFEYALVDFVVKNIRTNATIESYTASIPQFNKQTNNYFYLDPATYNFTISALGFANGSVVSTLPQNVTTLNVSLYPTNSVLITIYNASSSAKITSNVEVYLEKNGTTIYSNTTTSGELFLSNLNASTYKVTIISSGFQNAEYTLTIGEGTFQTLDVYMSAETNNINVFTLRDVNTGNVVEGASVSVQKFINGSFTLVNSLTSDITGRVQFFYDTGVRYRFIVSKNDYETKTFELNPIIFNSYNIWLDPIISVEPSIQELYSFYFEPREFVNNANNSVSAVFTSPSGSLEYFKVVINYPNGEVARESTNAYGTTFEETIEIIGSEFGDRVQVEKTVFLTDGRTLVQTQYYIITATPSDTGFLNVGSDYGLGLFERALITIILVISISGAAFIFGGITAAGVMALLIMGFMIQITFLSAWLLVPSMIFTFLLLAWRYA